MGWDRGVGEGKQRMAGEIRKRNMRPKIIDARYCNEEIPTVSGVDSGKVEVTSIYARETPHEPL